MVEVEDLAQLTYIIAGVLGVVDFLLIITVSIAIYYCYYLSQQLSELKQTTSQPQREREWITPGIFDSPQPDETPNAFPQQRFASDFMDNEPMRAPAMQQQHQPQRQQPKQFGNEGMWPAKQETKLPRVLPKMNMNEFEGKQNMGYDGGEMPQWNDRSKNPMGRNPGQPAPGPSSLANAFINRNPMNQNVQYGNFNKNVGY